jgi:hypothetical protein
MEARPNVRESLRSMRTMFTQSNKAVHLVSERVGVAILTNPAVGVSAQPVVVKPLSDASLCLKNVCDHEK